MLYVLFLFFFPEFAKNGSLYEYLKNDKDMLDFAHIVRWAREIAQGN